MFFNRKLNRGDLLEIVHKFDFKNKENKDNTDNKQVLYELLLNLEQVLNKYNLKEDDRFFTYCRREHLRKEFTDKLNKKHIETNSDYLTDAYYNLYDYIVNDTWISLASIPEGVSAKEVLKKDEEYKKSGIICSQEKQILLEMIQELKEAVKYNIKELEEKLKICKDIDLSEVNIDEVDDLNEIKLVEENLRKKES